MCVCVRARVCFVRETQREYEWVGGAVKHRKTILCQINIFSCGGSDIKQCRLYIINRHMYEFKSNVVVRHGSCPTPCLAAELMAVIVIRASDEARGVDSTTNIKASLRQCIAHYNHYKFS